MREIAEKIFIAISQMKRRTTSKKKRKTKSRITDGRRKFSQLNPMHITRINSVSCVPDAIEVKLKYVALQRIDTTSAFFYDAVFRGNSLFDPDLTLTGHQPLGFDQWKTFYNRYRVLACSAKLNVDNAAAGPSLWAVFGPSTSSTSYSGDLSDALEQPRAKVMGPIEVASRRAHTMKHYMTTSEAMGVTPETVKIENEYSAATSASPSKIWYWHLSFLSTDQSSDILVNFILELTFYCQMFERIPLSLS